MDIILTISLLASDRRESLERCLDSLKPLLVKLPSELIIVFTGTDPKVREIAEAYTPQVIPFTWCGDFSAARNAGLKEAQGEWFLYIDDDEWFDSVDEICEFFLSGEYRRYRSAHYIQRNYQDWNGTKYSDFSAFRMIQRSPESHFSGAIHEELVPRLEPCRYFQTCAHHYGYIKSAGETQKTARNIPMLLQAIENQPEQVKNYMQLTKEFDLAGDWKSAEEYCRRGRAVCRELNEPYCTGWLQAYLAHLVSKKPGKAPSVSELESILTNEQPSDVTCLILYQQLARLCAEEKEPEKAVAYGWKFETLLKRMDEGDGIWELQSYGEFSENYIKAPERLYGTRLDCTACALEIHDFTSAAYFLKLFPWETEALLCRYYPELDKWQETYSTPYIEILLGLLKDIAKNFGISELSLVPILEEPKAPLPTYLLFQKSLDDFRNGENGRGVDLLVYCILHTKDSYLQQQLLKTAIRCYANAVPFVSQTELGTWNSLISEAVQELPFTLNERLQVWEDEIAKQYPLHRLCLKRQRLLQKLRKGFPLWEEMTTDLETYCLCTIEFFRCLYREELFHEEICSFLPAEWHFAQTTLKAMDSLRQGQITESVRLLGDAFRICPDMTGIVTELFRQASRRLNDPALHADPEFLNLAGQMKKTLHTLLETNQTTQASRILAQLLPLMPEDLEFIRIRQDLIRRTKS